MDIVAEAIVSAKDAPSFPSLVRFNHQTFVDMIEAIEAGEYDKDLSLRAVAISLRRRPPKRGVSAFGEGQPRTIFGLAVEISDEQPPGQMTIATDETARPMASTLVDQITQAVINAGDDGPYPAEARMNRKTYDNLWDQAFAHDYDHNQAMKAIAFAVARFPVWSPLLPKDAHPRSGMLGVRLLYEPTQPDNHIKFGNYILDASTGTR